MKIKDKLRKAVNAEAIHASYLDTPISKEGISSIVLPIVNAMTNIRNSPAFIFPFSSINASNIICSYLIFH
jgi:hypothetical protein